MIVHAVRFDCTGVDEEERRSWEELLRGLVEIDEVRWLRVGRDIAEPHITGLLSVHDDEAALEGYRTHPAHQPSIVRTRELGISVTRFDLETDDDAADLP